MRNKSAAAKETGETVCMWSRFARTSLKPGVNEMGLLAVLLLFGMFTAAPLKGADTLRWGTNSVSADIRSMELMTVLEKISGVTGWHVFVEPETLHTVSAKF